MSEVVFTQKFDAIVCDGESISAEVDGFALTATIHRDDDSGSPWESEDGHGPVSDWTSRPKRPGERVVTEGPFQKRYYDLEAATALALKDGWGVTGGRHKGETKRAYAARAAEHDFEVLKAWCNDEWWYVGVAVTVAKAGIPLTGKYDHALWGVEANYPG